MTKYNYRVDYEEAIKQMSKEESSRGVSKEHILTWIANELAEANRLKRLEIRSIITNFNQDSPTEIWWKSPAGQHSIKELKDQA